MKNEETNGWKLLFDGKTMAGWRTYQDKAADSWSVKDGTFYCQNNCRCIIRQVQQHGNQIKHFLLHDHYCG